MAKNSRVKRRRKFVDDSFNKDGYCQCPVCKRYIHKDEKDSGGHLMITVDHVIPRSRGGIDDIENFMAMCKPCNRIKGGLTLDEFAIFVKFLDGEKLNEDQYKKLLLGIAKERGIKL